MNRHTINSVVDYLKLIQDQKLTNHIFRGQNEPFLGIQASGFRPYEPLWCQTLTYCKY